MDDIIQATIPGALPTNTYGGATPSALDYGVDSTAMAGGAKESVWTSGANLLTKAAPLIARSVYLSFRNMPADIGNWFGMDNHIQTMEESIGDDPTDADLQSYYAEHSQGIDATALIAGSFIPGLGATKFLSADKLVSRIAEVGAGAAKDVGFVTGLLPSVQRAKVLAQATEEITKNVTVYSAIASDTFKASALGIADQALQAAAWETATIATMHSNPSLQNDGFVDSVDHVFWGGITGGLFMSPFSILGSRTTLLSVKAARDLQLKGQQLVDTQGKGDFLIGDRLLETVGSVFNQERVAPAVTTAQKSAEESRSAAVRMDATAKLNAFSDDPAVSNGLVDFVYKAREMGVPLVGEGSTVGIADQLAGVRSVHRVTNPEFLTANDSAFFLNAHGKNTVVPEWSTDPAKTPNWWTTKFDPTAEKSQRFTWGEEFNPNDLRRAAFGDPMSPQILAAADNLAPTATKAWEYGFHTWSDATGRLHLNPDASLIGPNGRVLKSLPADTQLPTEVIQEFQTTGKLPADMQQVSNASGVLNLKTGAFSKDAWPRVGDVATPKLNTTTGKLAADSPVKLVDSGNSLEVAGTVYKYGLSTPYKAGELTNLEANGRFAWASIRGVKAGDIIAADDLPMLEQAAWQLKGAEPEEWEKFRLAMKTSDGKLTEFPHNIEELQQHVIELKQNILRELTPESGEIKDAADLATRVNSPVDWIGSGGANADFSKLSINPAEHLDLHHVRVNYSVSPLAFDSTADTARGFQAMQYRIDRAQALTTNASYNFFGDSAKDIIVNNSRAYNSSSADLAPTSSTFFKRADAEQGTLAARLQFSAKVLLQKIQDAVDESGKYMQPHYHAILADPAAGAELASLRNAHLRMQEKFALLPTNDSAALKQQAEKLLGRDLEPGESLLVPRRSLGTDTMGSPTWNQDYKPSVDNNAHDAAKWVTATQLSKMPQGASSLEGEARSLGMYPVSGKVSDFLRTQQAINDQRLMHTNNFFNVTGNSRVLETGNVYFPPVNTRNYSYVAFVRQRDGLGGGTSAVSAVLGKDAADLQQKIALIRDNHPELVIHEQGKTKEYLKARGDYDYNLNMTDNDVNSMLHKSGVLADHVPNMDGKTTLSDYAEWDKNQITVLHRNYAELANAQLYAEFDLMGKQYEWLANSKIGSVKSSEEAAKAIDNPYKNLKFQGLGINPRVGYTLWNDSQDKVEALFTTAFNKAKQAFGDASKGLISFDEAVAINKAHGLGDPYGTTITAMRSYQLAGVPPYSPALEKFVRTANSVQTALSIRLDAMQGLVNAISTPILMWPEALDAARKLGITQLQDGTKVGLLALPRLFVKAIADWHSDPATEFGLLKQQAFDKGLLNMKPSAYYDLQNALTLYGNETASKLSTMGSDAVERASNLIGTNFSEQFGRYAAINIAYRIGQAGGKSGEDLWSFINTFLGRVHGSSIAAQRPIAFQGPIGAAIGLFQTYQFNFMQNVFRYIGEGNYKALSLLGGLQTTLYGMQGMPGFNFINQSIIGNAVNNPAHSDIYSGTTSLLGKDIADVALYGGVSNILGAGLYTRGDVNPRSMTVLPVNPLDIPTVASGLRAITNLSQMASKLNDGGSFWSVFTEGLEHNALSRPVAGFAQVLQGYSTTSQGTLISANRGTDITGVTDIFNVTNAMRIAGSRPLDEAVIMDAAFRRTAYQAADTARMQVLGDSVKNSIRAGAVPSDDQMNKFVTKYVAAGGYPTNFGKAMINWTKDANTSVANEVYKKLQTPAIRNQQLIMGGKMLPDYSMAPINSGAGGAAEVAAAGTQVSQPQ